MGYFYLEMGTQKGTEKNSKKYKSQVKKDLQKKISATASKNKQVYRNQGGGSKVVKRGRGDVSSAPAVYADKIKRGGMANYGHYYPYQEGVLDKQMALSNYYDRALKQQHSANQFHNLFTGLAAGKFEDLDENRRKIIIEEGIEMEKRRRLEELENIKKNTKETEIRNKAKLKELGMPEDAKDVDIVEKQERASRRLKNATKVAQDLSRLGEGLNEMREQEKRLVGIAAGIRKDFGSNRHVAKLTDNIMDVTPDMIENAKADLSKQYANIAPAIQRLMEVRSKVQDLGST